MNTDERRSRTLLLSVFIRFNLRLNEHRNPRDDSSARIQARVLVQLKRDWIRAKVLSPRARKVIDVIGRVVAPISTFQSQWRPGLIRDNSTQ